MVQVGSVTLTPRCGSPAVHLPWGMRSDRPPTFRIVGRQRSALRAAGPTPTNDEPNGGNWREDHATGRPGGAPGFGSPGAGGLRQRQQHDPHDDRGRRDDGRQRFGRGGKRYHLRGCRLHLRDRSAAVLGFHRAGQGHGAVDRRLQRQVRRRTSTPTAAAAPARASQDFIANQVDFAGSDSALNADQASQAQSTSAARATPRFNLPMVTGPIALAYNLSGVDSLILTPEVLAGIFAGTITTWNDPAIAAINPGVTLPSLAIQAVHRAEDSGTTDNFTKYLAAAAAVPGRSTPGKSWTAPGGVAAQGSDGVSKQVTSTDGSIGYVEWGFAQDDGLNVAQIDNGGGAVELTAESAGQGRRGGRGRRHRRRPGAEAGLRDQGAGRLPGRPGHLRDRLLGRQRRRHRPAAEVLPGLHVHRRAGRPGPSWVPRRCPPRSRSRSSSRSCPSVDPDRAPGPARTGPGARQLDPVSVIIVMCG